MSELISGLGKAARIVLLDLAIDSGQRNGIRVRDVDPDVWRRLGNAGYVLADRAGVGTWTASREPMCKLMSPGLLWLRKVLEQGQWRTTDQDERARWDTVLEIMRDDGSELWTEPVPAVLERGGEYGQSTLGDEAADAALAALVAEIYRASGNGRSRTLERLVRAAPAGVADRRSWLERADEIARAWGRPLLGRDGWITDVNHPMLTAPAAPTSAPRPSRRAPARA